MTSEGVLVAAGNALHVAAHDGNLGMLASVGRVLAHQLVKGEATNILKDALNAHGHTPDGTLAVMVAAEGGEPQVSLSISSRQIECIFDFSVAWSLCAPDRKCACLHPRILVSQLSTGLFFLLNSPPDF